ncbi:valine--tRNA ligase [Jannaschia seohaensis]|uniref:Valine--tRNA ligase n=1 Tax=Jannaschia seohaensis TaxID=475081 RepID=A0A2Y9C773_9RHOB|nr:valine--tRNA ligase [Jannaschia seohaensis]PWJ20497.1 valyl-tRNA synthetase [Jannaschia seohaensis]SSA44593.1 valyl-tRNA synthetase [Jannaschia seohaensis]
MEKTFDAAEAEARISRAWIDGGYFRAGANASRPETFSIVIPPPNVTGSLHMGHAFNNTLQDILVRWHRMRGFDTLWQPGTDHAGIATQMVTERDMAANGEPTRQEMGRAAFLDRVWQQKAKSRGTIIGQLQRLGASCDWEREAFTMGGAPGDPDPTEQNFHDAVIKVFVEMYEQGLIYRGKRLVNWDPKFETAISDLEVENIETPGFMWHFKYPLAGGATYEYVERDEDGNELFRETRDYISIATTRPETMLGDGAVAVHPDDARYAPIVGQLCEIPVGPKEHRRLIPIIADEYPDPNFGSGAVKITGAHDFNDYEVAKRGNIPLYRLMDSQAAMRADGAPYAEAAAIAMQVAKGERTLTEADADAVNLVPDHLRGLDRFEARKKVVEEITEEGLAVMVPATDPRLGKVAKPTAPEEGGEPRTEPEALVPLVEPKPIMQPHGDRSKVAIEPMLTDQWFVDTDKIVGEAISAVEDGIVRILPEADKKVYFHWLRNIEPWCISRQLWWGHRIPVWYTLDPDGDADWLPVCAPNEAEALRHLRLIHGEDADIRFVDTEAEALDIIGDDLAGLDTRTEGMIRQAQGPQTIPAFRDPDVLDTWFSSGLWPLGTLGWPDDTEELRKYFPTSVLITGFDILFFWVARMMMMQTSVLPKDLPLEARIPFKDVYVHALVRDEKGKKMSKSLGNVLDPLDLIDEYGADAVRFTLAAMAAMGRDLKLSADRIKGYRNFGTKLWNAVRFAEMNGVLDVMTDVTTEITTPDSLTQTVNRWIVGETARTREEVDAALDAYRFDEAAHALYRFVWNVVCDWYVEFSKPLLQCEDLDAKAETQRTMAWVLERCMTMLHPFMPFITEELWRVTSHDGMLVHGHWPETLTSEAVDPAAETEIRWVIAFIEAVRSARAQMNVPASARIPVIAVEWSKDAAQAFENNAPLIQAMARIEGLTEGDAPKGSLAVTVGTDRFALPLGDVIDVAAEMARLTKSAAKLDKEIQGLQGRVNNPNFAASAPPEVVEEARANLSARQGERAALQTALDSLAELD